MCRIFNIGPWLRKIMSYTVMQKYLTVVQNTKKISIRHFLLLRRPTVTLKDIHKASKGYHAAATSWAYYAYVAVLFVSARSRSVMELISLHGSLVLL